MRQLNSQSETKIKVLHIIKSLGRGGAEMLLPETLGMHDKQNFEFHYIYFLSWKDQMVESIRRHGSEVTCFPARNNIHLILKAWAVAAYVRKHKIQLIHAHLPWAGLLARIAGRLTKIPVVYTEHNKQERYHWVTRFLNIWTMNWLTKVIAVSSDVDASIRKYKPNLAVPIQTIVNGVNVEKFDRNQFSRVSVVKLNIPPDALIIGTIAVFRFQKRLDLWIELAAKISKEVENVHFVIVGDGPLKEDLIAKRQALGLTDRIHMPGLESEIRPYLVSFDIYMMCSVFEGLPIALLEAMSMECPVITTDAGGIKEVVRHGLDGLMCSVDEPDRLVEFASMLLHDKAVRAKYGAQGRKRVKTEFSMEQMVRELEKVYRTLSPN